MNTTMQALSKPEVIVSWICRSIAAVIRYATDDDLRAGRGLTILELNGAGAEATSIYDTRNTLLSAYRTLYRQWELVFRIGALNHTRGACPASLPTLLREWRRTSALIADYPFAD